MTALHPFVADFLEQCRNLGKQQQMRAELRRLVIECKQASDAGDRKRARTLLREAERVRAHLER